MLCFVLVEWSWFWDMELTALYIWDQHLSLIFAPNPTYLAGTKTSIPPANKVSQDPRGFQKVHLTLKHQMEIIAKPSFYKSGLPVPWPCCWELVPPHTMDIIIIVHSWCHVGWILSIIVSSWWSWLLRNAHIESPHQFKHRHRLSLSRRQTTSITPTFAGLWWFHTSLTSTKTFPPFPYRRLSVPGSG